jgi:hypothetical protein
MPTASLSPDISIATFTPLAADAEISFSLLAFFHCRFDTFSQFVYIMPAISIR